ncbi:MAG: ribosome maturation factor RimM [Burkholderiales bacterium]|nr:ribosome maturation factor RimM [Burkholderiales bacterium]
MGRVAAPFGVKGWIRVQTFTEAVDGLLDYPSWWVGSTGQWQEYRVEQGSAHGQGIVAKLAGFDVPEAAAKLRGQDVAVPREALPEVQDGFYWTDLVGLKVVNKEGIELGRVDTLLDNGAQSVLVVKGEREWLIPFVPVYVDRVELEAGRILVDWQQDY